MEFGEGPGGRVDMSRVEGAAYAVSRDRVLGYFTALAAAGIDTAGVPVFETNADPTSVDRAMEELFGAGERPTALLAQSDRIAMRALEWLKVRGIAVPGDVSVTGFDGVPEGEATLPPLTTVRQPIRELGRRAVQLILDPGPGVRRERLEVDLLVRGSTASPAS
jgi:DNA-binding LacI/PurR family transcriptional regulator